MMIKIQHKVLELLMTEKVVHGFFKVIFFMVENPQCVKTSAVKIYSFIMLIQKALSPSYKK